MQHNGKELYVQFGCGFSAPQNWRNFDASPTLRFEKMPIVGRLYSRNGNRFPANVEYGDIVKGLPLPDESCAAIYASHVLEHLSLEDFQAALKNTFKLLQPDGLFRLVVPDLETLAKRYVESGDPNAAVDFMRETSLGTENRSRTLRGFARSWLGNSSHLWMWDFKSLTQELSKTGFVDIRKCAAGDEPVFTDAEDPGRFVDSLAVQCRKS
jgi:SAM-dependent methyltransferase